MAVETQADIDSFFDADEFAEAATYTPAVSGVPQAVTVIMNRPRDEAAFGPMGVVASQRLASLRKSEVALPARGDSLTMAVDGEVLKVEKFTLDRTARIYTLDLGP